LRVFGQRALDLGREHAFTFKFGLEAQKALEQITLSGAADRFDIELELASRFVKRNQSPCFNHLPIFQAPA